MNVVNKYQREKMKQIVLKDEKLIEIMSKAMAKRGMNTKIKYITALIKRDCRDLGILKVDDLI